MVVTGPDLIGKSGLIVKGILYSVERKPKKFQDGLFKIDLQGISSKQAALVKISEILNYNEP